MGRGTGRLMLGSTIFKEHKIPKPPPMGTDQSEDALCESWGPNLGDQQREIAAPDIDRPVEDPLVVGPRSWDPHCSPIGYHSRNTAEAFSVTIVLSKHQQHGTGDLEAAF